MHNSTKLFTAFSLFFIAVTTHAQIPAVADKIIATVGDKIILRSELMNSFDDQRRMSGADVPDSLICTIAEQTIIFKILVSEAEKDSIVIGDDEIEAELQQRIRGVFQDSEKTIEENEKIINRLKEQAWPAIKERRMVEAMQNKITQYVRITPGEVQSFYNKIPKDQLPMVESELELCQIVIYPKPSRDMEEYVSNQMNNYKNQIESKLITFQSLLPTEGEGAQITEFNRNDKRIDPAFLSAIFRLKEGEISHPVKTKFGYFLIHLVRRDGDIASVRYVMRSVPVSKEDVDKAINKLDSIRSQIVANTISFNEAAGKYDEDEQFAFTGHCITNRNGDPRVTIDELDKETITAIARVRTGGISAPAIIASDYLNRKPVRIIYLKSRTEPHLINLKDDYAKLSQLAMQEKKQQAIQKWVMGKLPVYHITIDGAASNTCISLRKYGSTD
ncbi:MAG TPA: peptidylprolyl isomerase [Chitinophagaceae bacterium]|nr:peptidylprolyl isomerase [Chitinophagaceae bacterium]